MCISSPNLENWVKIRSRPFSRTLILSNKNSPFYTYSMQNNSKIFPELKDFGLWLKIWPVERGKLLCLENVAFVRPFFVHSFYDVLKHSMMRNMNRTGYMLSPFLAPNLKGIGVSMFPIISLTTLVLYILLVAEKNQGGAPYLDRMSISSL